MFAQDRDSKKLAVLYIARTLTTNENIFAYIELYALCTWQHLHFYNIYQYRTTLYQGTNPTQTQLYSSGLEFFYKDDENIFVFKTH
jgi:hypothetical protein